MLRKLLPDGRLLGKPIEKAARERGLALITVQRAKQRLGIVSMRQGFGPTARWFGNLPDADTQAPTRP